MKRCLKFYFSAEGETECYYLQHLKYLINLCDNAKYKVDFDAKPLAPKSYIKRLNIREKTTVYHLFDYEGREADCRTHFENVLSQMKSAQKLGREVIYKNGYSNLTFELWILLHKTELNGAISHRKNYLEYINKAFGTKYQSLKEYKEEKHFKEILKGISLDDVKEAVKRMSTIMQNNKYNGYEEKRMDGFSWYAENPASALGEIIGYILQDCGIM